MGFKKWINTTAAALLLASSIVVPTQAEETRTIADESIYDVLVDRYFNGTASNDFNVNAQDPADFAGGDFSGLVKKSDHILKMGYTMISIGAIFETEKYDGSLPTTFTQFEDHFGTEEELKNVVAHYHENDVKVMVDFPLSNVSANHEWAENADWIASAADGVAKFDLTNPELQQALIDSVVTYVTTYGFDGVRLTNIEEADTAFLNQVIAAIKNIDPAIYVIANGESNADFDANFHSDYDRIFKDAFKNVDLSAEDVPTYVTEDEKPTQIMMDNVWTDRFTYEVMGPEGNDYPPNRLPLALVTTLLLPGVPVTQYGTEIGMNGAVGPESHQYFNFKTDEELVDKITKVQTLRNTSDTIRSGEFNVLKNEGGFFVFERKSDKEHWVIVVNNTSVTQRIDLTTEQLGEGKELRSKIGEDEELVRLNKEGEYPIIQDRETIEVYQVIDETGIQISYVAALGVVYVLFFAFVYIVIKRGRKRRAEQDAGKAAKG